MKILLAEDTQDLNRALTVILQHENYEVTSVFDGEEALEALAKESFDGIVLDIMMPKKSGLEVLEEMRSHGDVTPVLLLTAKAEVDDRVTGLDAGADDYLTKPFAMKELVARVRSMTRRHVEYGDKELRYGDILLKAESFELTSENTVRLSIKEFALMQILITHENTEVDTQYLLDQVWRTERDAQADTVWLYISYLKGKLNAISSNVTIDGERGGKFRLVKK